MPKVREGRDGRLVFVGTYVDPRTRAQYEALMRAMRGSGRAVLEEAIACLYRERIGADDANA